LHAKKAWPKVTLSLSSVRVLAFGPASAIHDFGAIGVHGLILLIFDSVEKMDPIRDTSLQFLDAANFIESEKVYWTTPEQLGWSGGGELSASIPQARCFLFSKGTNGLPNAQTETTFKPLHEFSTIYMRKEPPVDTLFLSITWMLDRALELSPKLRIFNSPAALRGLNEKTIIFEFPDKIAEALVSASPDRITHFSKQFGTDGVVLKPLDGFGGRGVVHLKPEQLSEKHIRDLLPTGSAPVIVQPFDSAVFDGEVRVF